MKEKKEKVLAKNRNSTYYSNVAKARWDKVKENRIQHLALRFERIFTKMQGSTKEVIAYEIAKTVINKKIK